MTKQVYRGVESESADKPKNDHHHEDGLTYRGAPLDGAQAEKDAEAADSNHKKVYRGVEGEGETTRSVYRGVEGDSADKAKTDHHHADGLVYRGAALDGEQAEKDAQPVSAGHKHVYRGVEEEDDKS